MPEKRSGSGEKEEREKRREEGGRKEGRRGEGGQGRDTALLQNLN